MFISTQRKKIINFIKVTISKSKNVKIIVESRIILRFPKKGKVYLKPRILRKDYSKQNRD